MARYGVAYGGTAAHETGGGRLGGARPAGQIAGATQAVSYVLAPGEEPMCVGKLKKNGWSCPNKATIGPHCAGHARQAEKQQKDR